jgi:hypothetical protein
MKRGGARANRDALAVQKADDDEIAHGPFYGVTLADLARQGGDCELLRVRVKDLAEDCSLDGCIATL